MYPLHFNYTTTLPCKTITMKITIFIIVFVLKSIENMEIWHFRQSQLASSSKPCKNNLFEDVFKVSAHSVHTSSNSFDKAQYGLVDEVLKQIIRYCLQDFLRLIDGIYLGLKCLVTFKHSSPDMLIKRIKVWWVRWPLVYSDEVTAVGGNPVLSQLCRMSRCSIQFTVLWLFRHDHVISQSLLTQCLDSHFTVHKNFTHDSSNQLTSGYT